MLFLMQSAPYGDQQSQAGLECLLAASAFTTKISVLFLGEGVWQLLKNQNSQMIQQTSLYKQLCALQTFDINAVYAAETDLQLRGISQTEIISNCVLISQTRIQNLILTNEIIFTF